MVPLFECSDPQCICHFIGLAIIIMDYQNAVINSHQSTIKYGGHPKWAGFEWYRPFDIMKYNLLKYKTV